MGKNISIILSINDKASKKVKRIGNAMTKLSAPMKKSAKDTDEIRRKAQRLRECMKENTKEAKRLKEEKRQIKKATQENIRKARQTTKEAERLKKALEKNKRSTKGTKEEADKLKRSIAENKKRMQNITKESKRLSTALKKNEKNVKGTGNEAKKLKKELGKIKGLKALNLESKKALYNLKRIGIQGVKAINTVIRRAAKLGATMAAAAGAFAIKTGLSEAMDLEGYKLQLETATKSTKKASKIMSYAIDLANRTPFEGGQLVEGAAKFEAMGMSAKKWLTLAGDMAAATNKDFDQATEALIDAQTGELERLKEFGIKKQAIVDKANEMFKNHEIVNKKDQIVDQKKFNKALIALMKERYSGGMEKQSKSLKGIMSTISGVMKSGLASIMGMQSDGSIAKGSLFDILKEKAEMLAEKVQQWQSDGTFTAIQQKVSQGIAKVFQWIEKLFRFLEENKSTIKSVVVTVLKLAVAFKAVMIIVKIIAFLKKVWAILSGIKTIIMIVAGVSSAAAIGIMAGIAAIIAIVVLLIKNWDAVKEAVANAIDWMCEKIDKAGEWISSTANGIGEAFSSALERILEKAKSVFNAIMEYVQPIIDTVGKVADFVGGGIKKITNGVSSFFGGKSTKGHATGTTYASGGLRMINERGSGEIVDLPNGSRVIPADKSRKLSGGTKIELNVTIQGNVIGNEKYAEEMGNVIFKKLIPVLDNM